MKILGIIPARGGSKGVPRKNLKMLGNSPLIAYTWESAQQSQLLSDIILSSEDDAIIDWAKNNGLEVPFVRPKALATDTASSIDVVIHAINTLERQNKYYDAVCLLQPTYPFREKGFIDKALEKFIKSNADSLISVLKVPHEYNPHWTFCENEKGFLKIATGENEIIKRRQDLPLAYFRDGNIYITRVEVIKSQQSFYGDKISFIESDESFYCNIDTMEDWIKAETIFSKLQ